MLLLMKKFYSTCVATLLATAAFAQSPAVPTMAKGTFTSPVKLNSTSLVPGSQRTSMRPGVMSKSFKVAPAARKAAADSEFITEQPEGTLYGNYYGSGQGFLTFWGYVFSSNVDGTVENFVMADDGSVYLQNAVSTIKPGSWIKGYKADGDTIKFDFPQKYYSQEATDDDGNPTGETEYFYLYRLNLQTDEESGSQWLYPDETTQTISYVLRNDSLIRVDDLDDNVYLGLCTEDGDWTGYADYLSTWSKQTDVTYAPSASAQVEKYQINYLDDSGQEDSRLVNVAVDGNDLYLGNLSDGNPDGWAKGKISDGKVVFDGKIYMGVDKSLGYHTYFSAIGITKVWSDYYQEDIDSTYFEKSIAFAYNAEAKTLKTDGIFCVNAGKNNVYAIGQYEEANVFPWVNKAGKPQNPEIVDFSNYDDEYGYGAMQIWLEKNSVEGNMLDPGKMYYNVYFDGELYTLYPDEYQYISEEMTDIPYNFSDGVDVLSEGKNHVLYFFTSGFETVGVQLAYKDGDEVYKSDIVTYAVDEEGNLTAGIDNAAVSEAKGSVAGVSYTDISGRRVLAPTHGVYLKTVKYADGTQKTLKYVKR